MAKIPTGYRLTVTSWENDADNYKTMSMAGLTEANTAFLVQLVKLFRSRHDHRGAGIGNMYHPSEVELATVSAALRDVLSKHPNQNLVEPDNPNLNSHLYELLYDLGLTGGDFFTRVIESYTVEYVPIALIKDVTKQFD